MKIAHLISQFYPVLGGAEICVHNICRKLVENGDEAMVVTTIKKTKTPPAVNYPIIHLSPKTNGLFRRSPFLGALYLRHAIRKLQRKHKFDLWQVTMGYPLGAYIVDFFKKSGIPCLLRCCGEDIQKVVEIGYGYRLDPTIDTLVAEKYKRFDGLVALTPSVEREYLDIGVPKEKIRIIPNGVDTARFAEMPADPSLREKLGVDSDTTIILTVGRHHPKKGYDQIPIVAKRLKDRGLKFAWVIVGRNREGFEKQFPDAKELGIHTIENSPSPDDDAFSLPSRSLIQLYRSADLFAFPTLLETFGMVLIEAMAAGLPVVTTDALGVRDVIFHKQNGLVSPVGNLDAFTNHMIELLENRQTFQHYQKASLEGAKRYDWSNILSEYLEMYQNTIR